MTISTVFEDAELTMYTVNTADIISSSVYVNEDGGIVMPTLPFPEG